MMPNLSALLGLALVLLGGVAWYLHSDNTAKAGRIAALELEAETRETADIAAAIGRAVNGAGRAEVESIVRNFIAENASAPTSDACLRDPAIARSYDALDRMQRAHEDAVRIAGGGASPAVRAPKPEQRPRR